MQVHFITLLAFISSIELISATPLPSPAPSPSSPPKEEWLSYLNLSPERVDVDDDLGEHTPSILESSGREHNQMASSTSSSLPSVSKSRKGMRRQRFSEIAKHGNTYFSQTIGNDRQKQETLRNILTPHLPAFESQNSRNGLDGAMKYTARHLTQKIHEKLFSGDENLESQAVQAIIAEQLRFETANRVRAHSQKRG